MTQTRPYPGFWHAVLLCVIFVAVQMTTMVPAGILDAIFHLNLSTHPVVLGFANLCGFVVVLIVARAFAGPVLSEFCSLRGVTPVAVAGVVLASAGSIIVLSEVDNLFRFILPVPEPLAKIFESLFFSGQNLLGTAFLLMIVAPVTEEIMFRGVILRGFLRRFNLAGAFILSSLLFGATHLNPWQFVSAMLLGVLFAWWYARTRSLIPSLLGHFLVNSMVVVAPRLPFEIRGFNMGDFLDAPQLQPIWFDGLGVFLLLIGIWLFRAGSEPIQLPSPEGSEAESRLSPVTVTPPPPAPVPAPAPDSTNS
jgi:hypothetical protein